MNFQDLYDGADAAGRMAVNQLVVTPMVVGTAKSLFSSEIDYSQPVEVVEDGVCGFAQINLKPANSRFAKWLRDQQLADKRYDGPGVYIWVSDFNQSYQKKTTYARAFANTLREAGLNAWITSRLD